MIISSISIILTILSILLITFKVIKVKWYPLVIYIVGLLVVYTTTLPGYGVVGTDISRELLMSNLAIQNGWNLTLFDVSNSSVVVGWFVPRLSEFLNIAPQWVYKVILPMIFACTPVLLYLVFRKQFVMPCSAPVTHSAALSLDTVHSGSPSKHNLTSHLQEYHGSLKAFFAAIFFIIMPVYALEIGTIGKSMVAEALMALCLFTMFTNWRVYIKCISMVLLVLLTLWAHYTVGILFVCYFGGALVILLAIKMFRKWKLWNRKVIPLWVIAVILVVSSVGFWGYYSRVSSGMVWNAVANTGSAYNALVASYIIHPQGVDLKEAEERALVLQKNPTATSEEKAQAEADRKEAGLRTLADNARDRDPLVGMGVGKDFIVASLSGKIFRVIQYLTQLLIVIGAFWLLFRYKRYNFSAEFIAFAVCSFAMLAACIAIPMFSTLINATRNYQIALFFLAPMFVLGCEAIGSIRRVRIET